MNQEDLIPRCLTPQPMLCTLALLLSVCCALLLHAGLAAAQTGQPLRLALQWYPQTQFAGYYMAQVKGFYAERGLDVTIQHGDADADSLDQLATGKTDFATAFLSAAMERHAQGVELVNIAQIVQRSALMLVARKNSAFTTIKDLDGARIGTWGDKFQLQPKALFRREKIHVSFVRQSPSFDLFMRGGLDATLAMWYNEYHRLMAYGLNPEEMTTFFFSDLDLNQPEDGIYCLTSTLQQNPQAATDLVQASVKGWEYAFAHPEETVDTLLAIMKREKVRANRAHQRWMLARMQDIILKDGQTTLDTRLNQTDFEHTGKALVETGVIPQGIVYNDFFRGMGQ